jgi:hypothetical protein
VVTVDEFEAALATAREFIVGFSDRYARCNPRSAAVETLSAVAGYSDDRLVDLLVDRAGDSLRAVVLVGANPVPVYGVEAGGTAAGVDVETLCESVRTAGEGPGSVGAGDLRGTVTLLAAVTVL